MKRALSLGNQVPKFERASSSLSDSSTSSSSRHSLSEASDKFSKTLSLKNIKEVSFADIEQSLQNWNMPTVKLKDVYKQGSFSQKQDFIIKTEEDIHSIDSEGTEIHLISPQKIQFYKENYKYLHIGLIQVAIKPLTTLGLNTSVLASVCDKHHLEFNDSLLGMVEGSLTNGSIFFNCFPDFSISLNDQYAHEVATLCLHTKGFKMKGVFSNIAVIF